MGTYLNPGADKFKISRNSKIYIDKSGIIAHLNDKVLTNNRFVCISRPRRFGKTMAAEMIAAYYDKSTDAKELFNGLEIEHDESFLRHANKYDVIAINIQNFLSRTHSMDELIKRLQEILLHELLQEYPDYNYFDKNDLIETMQEIYKKTARPFVVIIDEWDAIFREDKEKKADQEKYLDFLRDWLKDRAYIGLAYMTGILPIKKYGTHSALNMFTEYSMTNAGELARYVGFTENEVEALCTRFKMSFDEAKAWYDGYKLKQTIDENTPGARTENLEIYSPKSVVDSMLMGQYLDYWNQTETFEALRVYIDMNFDGLREAILRLMAGEEEKIEIRSFTNQMDTFENYEDVLTLLIHLGYLGYESDKKSVFIPNREVMHEFVTSTKVSNWNEIINSVKKSDELMQATWDMDEQAVADGIENAHLETSHLQYNDENALSYTISLAYYSARQYYTVARELPAGKGFADLVFIPRTSYPDKPAMIVELKWDKNAETAIKQIKDKNYPKALENFKGRMLLVGISYDKTTRKHLCLIEKL